MVWGFRAMKVNTTMIRPVASSYTGAGSPTKVLLAAAAAAASLLHVLLATITIRPHVTPPSVDFLTTMCLLPQSDADVWLRPRPSAKASSWPGPATQPVAGLTGADGKESSTGILNCV